MKGEPLFFIIDFYAGSFYSEAIWINDEDFSCMGAGLREEWLRNMISERAQFKNIPKREIKFLSSKKVSQAEAQAWADRHSKKEEIKEILDMPVELL